MNFSEQLRLLSIFHYVVGGLHALFGCFGLIHFGLGISILLSPGSWETSGSAMPAFFPWIFILAGGAFVLFGVTLGVLTALSGRFISQRKHWTFSIVMGAINGALFPFGTTLGVFDLIVLAKDEVRLQYGA